MQAFHQIIPTDVLSDTLMRIEFAGKAPSLAIGGVDVTKCLIYDPQSEPVAISDRPSLSTDQTSI